MRIRRIRQLVPTKFATGYVHHPAHQEPTAEFCTRWMWFGHVFHQSTTTLGRVIETVNPDNTISYSRSQGGDV